MIFCVTNSIRLIDLQCCNYCHLPSYFASKFLSSMIVFHHKLSTREGKVLANGWTHPSSMNVSVQLFIRSVTQKVTIVTWNTIWHYIFSVAQCASNPEDLLFSCFIHMGPKFMHSGPNLIHNDWNFIHFPNKAYNFYLLT